MSREGKFRKLIGKIGREEKNCVWNKIEEGSDTAPAVAPGSATEPTAARRQGRGRFIRAAAVCTALVAFIGAGLAGGLSIGRKNSSQKETEDDDRRYCAQDKYPPVRIEMTLKEYAEASGREMLYWDWYDDALMPPQDLIYKDENGEFLAFRESLDVQTADAYYSAELSVAVGNADMEMFELYRIMCVEKYYSEKGGVDIYWGINDINGARAYFRYGAYTYYIKPGYCYSFAEEKEIGKEDETVLIGLAELLFGAEEP